MNRADRRKLCEEIQAEVMEGRRVKPMSTTPRSLTQSEKMRRIEQNGITLRDLEEARKKSFEEAYKAAGIDVVRSMMAATCLALQNLYGFGQKRNFRVLQEIDRICTESLVTEELIKEVFEKQRLELDFGDPFGIVHEI